MPQALSRRAVLVLVLGLLAGILGMHALGMHALGAHAAGMPDAAPAATTSPISASLDPASTAAASHQLAAVAPSAEHPHATSVAPPVALNLIAEPAQHPVHPASGTDCTTCAAGHDMLAACILALLTVALVVLRPTAWGRPHLVFAALPRLWPALARPSPPSLLALGISRR